MLGNPLDRYGKEMLDLLARLNVASIGPGELEQFAYEVNTKAEGKSIVVTTDELDIAAFLKVLIHRGARIEVYSAHDFPDTAHGRGK